MELEVDSFDEVSLLEVTNVGNCRGIPLGVGMTKDICNTKDDAERERGLGTLSDLGNCTVPSQLVILATLYCITILRHQALYMLPLVR